MQERRIRQQFFFFFNTVLVQGVWGFFVCFAVRGGVLSCRLICHSKWFVLDKPFVITDMYQYLTLTFFLTLKPRLFGM